MRGTLPARPTRKVLLAISLVLAASLGTVAWRRAARPRAWKVGEVPVAFWVWSNELPAEVEVESAAAGTKARVLFVRAGQLHAEGGRVARVRAPAGRFPRALPIHLVYNGTHALLNSFEQLDAGALATSISDTYRGDLKRAENDGARVEGLQLDLDVPTRLLPRYAGLLRALREKLQQGTRLSVTGLTTWMSSRSLAALLAAVDFWVPQFYGARIPETLGEALPVSSPTAVAADVARARELQRPFYAGLSAYGYAALYSKTGALVELRGDLDPDKVARNPNLELVERRAFDANPNFATARAADEPVASEWRYVFRARSDASIGDLVVREGERLMLDVPSAESLRASLRAVREEAGAQLIGVCLFRLPTEGDQTALTLAQISAALADRTATSETSARIERSDAADASAREEVATRLTVSVSNGGESGALLGEALTVTVAVPAGSLRGIGELKNFADVETLCGDVARGGALAPCGARRADAVRLLARSWRPGAKALAVLTVGGELPRVLPVSFGVRVDDGRLWRRDEEVLVGDGRER
ncbi:MAG: DUF3142 domain-containing protein [Pyrinomonadaceae bacterium]